MLSHLLGGLGHALEPRDEHVVDGALDVAVDVVAHDCLNAHALHAQMLRNATPFVAQLRRQEVQQIGVDETCQ